MRVLAGLFVLLLIADAPTRPEAALPYFSNVRDVRIIHSDLQNFFTVDEELWTHSRPDLGDLRLYSGDSPVQYAISEQRAGVSSEQVEAKILNLGTVAGHTEFDLDTQGLAEYDRIHLRLDAHDFVATASLSGGSAPGQRAEVQLPSSTLYDFSKQQLGSSFQIKLPTSSFRYLHVKLSSGIRAEQVKGATIDNRREQQALWTNVGSCSSVRQNIHVTVFSCNVPERIPLSRIFFQIDPAQVNFRRTITIRDSKGQQISAGDISRVRIKRGDTLVTDEDLAIAVSSNSGPVTIDVENGDNPPLNITAVQPVALARRVYFEPQGRSNIRLYYGDEQVEPPVYDYARFFHADPLAAEAQLGPGAHNPQYAARPDERPWSDRHPALLWSAMLVVVLALAWLAFRGLRTGTAR
jgi:uncharacterized protein DUF3999